MTGPSAEAAASARAVRALAAERPRPGLDPGALAQWYAEKAGALAWHAQVLADEIAPGPAAGMIA